MTRPAHGDLPSLDKKPSASAVRLQLSRILQSAGFKSSGRKSKFLTYIVEQSLAGRGDHLTAYDVAMGVFNRDERFDPRYDPLVRITARRVRAALDQYYLTTGRDDPLKIDIPKGHYRPVFDVAWRAETLPHRAATPDGSTTDKPRGRLGSPLLHPLIYTAALVLLVSVITCVETSRWMGRERGTGGEHRQRIVVTTIRNISANSSLERAADLMTQEFKLSFCCAEKFQVVPPSSPADFELTGSLQEDAAGIRAQFLIATTAGKVLWMHTYVLPQITGSELADAGITHDIEEELAQLRTVAARN